MQRLFPILALLLSLAAGVRHGAAQTFNSGSTGADGAFNPASTVTVPLPPNGVFNYTTVNIPVGVTVTFARNAGNTPVTILASGNVTIAGTISVSGGPGGPGGGFTGLGNNGGISGPGGFDGGSGANGVVSNTGGMGLGPGGGGGGTNANGGGAGAGFATNGNNGAGNIGATGGTGGSSYGAAALLPIVGGSGGGGGGAALGNTGNGGGGGGGALVIASSGTITLTGSILAAGGAGSSSGATGPSGGGSGGAVRLVATTITGTGTLNVGAGPGGPNTGQSAGGAGSVGRSRVEAFTNTANFNVAGVGPSVGLPTTAVLANAPVLQIVSVAGIAAPATPSGSLASPDVTLPATTTNPVSIALAGTNIPPGTAVAIRAQGQVDAVTSTSATLAGTFASSTGTASLAIPTNQPAVITAVASFTVTAAAGGAPLFAEGELVERVVVSSTLGGASRVAYITASGREIPVASSR